MRKIITIAILLFAASLSAQIQWEQNGLPIRQGVNIEWSRAATSLDDGSVVYVWSDTRRGDRDVWTQKVDINGNLLWGEDAILVNGEINRQEDPVVVNTVDGGVIIVWIDFRNEDAGDVYAQKLDTDGNLLWDTTGVPLCLAENVQTSLNIVNDTNGGAYIIWLDSRNPGGADIYGIHILSSGEIGEGWQVDGNPIAAENGIQNGHTLWEDGAGGEIVAWHDFRDADNENLYMQRISSDGTLLWVEGGILLCGASGIQEQVKIAPDGAGSFILVWRDRRYENDGDIFAQRVDTTGSLLWTNELEVYAGDGIQRNPRITTSSDGGAVVAWEDGRNDPYYVDIYSQKISLDGSLVWDETGIPICTAADHQLSPRLTNDSNGGCYFVWEDRRLAGHPYEDIYIQHIDADGNALWEENGKVICNANGEQFSPLLRSDGTGNVYAVWGDSRTGSIAIYVQILDNDGNVSLDENGEIIYYGLCGDALNYQILPNGNNSVILWEDTRNPYTGKQIFMQLLNADGSIGLEENGHPITVSTGSDKENLDAVFYTESNCIATVWDEARADKKKIYAQAVDIDGNFLWADSGLVVSTDISNQEKAKISVELTDSRSYNYYVGWSDSRGEWPNPIINKICGQKIQNGELQWGNEGLTIADIDGDDVLTDVVGRFFIWQNENWPEYNIYVKLVDEDGGTAPDWPDNGLLVCGAEGKQLNAKGVMTPLGLLVVWDDLRNGNLDIYGQIVTYDGDILWDENGIPLISLNNDQSKPVFFYDDGIYLAWVDFRSGVDYNVYMQKYNDEGEELWQANGVDVASSVSDKSPPTLVELGDNLFVGWEDCSDTTNSDIYAQKLNLSGELQWDDDGLLVCDAIKNQAHPLAVRNGDYYSTITWQDTRSSGKAEIYNIYAQKVKVNETDVDDGEHIINSFRLYQNYPNPFNPDNIGTTTISFSATDLHGLSPLDSTHLTGQAQIRIYNVKGQLVRHFAIRNPQSELTRVVWDGKDESGNKLSNGIYFYRLVSDNFESKAKKMILLR